MSCMKVASNVPGIKTYPFFSLKEIPVALLQIMNDHDPVFTQTALSAD